MATVFVSYKPNSNSKPPANLIQAVIGKETVSLIPVDIGNEKLNCIQAAQKAGVFIPHYCWHPALTVVASLPHVPGRSRRTQARRHGRDAAQGRARLPDAGQGRHRHRHQQPQGQGRSGADARRHPAQSPARLSGVRQGRRVHAAGLQLRLRPVAEPDDRREEHAAQQAVHRRQRHAVHRPLHHVLALRPLHPRDLRHGRVADHQPRRSLPRSTSSPASRSNNKLASNVVDLCPVGALCSKDFLYKHRVWNLKTQNSVCADCSTGCSINLDGNKNIVYRLRPRVNPQAQGHFMCDEGRLGYHYVNSNERILRPHAAQGRQADAIGLAGGACRRFARPSRPPRRRTPPAWSACSRRS